MKRDTAQDWSAKEWKTDLLMINLHELTSPKNNEEQQPFKVPKNDTMIIIILFIFVHSRAIVKTW